MMGSPETEKDRIDNECQHEVSVNRFHIGKYEVTKTQWRAVARLDPNIAENPSFHKGCNDCPVEQISWNYVQLWIKKLNALTGKNYRLPTEKEWEWAARGGKQGVTDGFIYSGSNNLGEVGNKGSETKLVGKGRKANQLGIFDMSGNIWEWCADMWEDYPDCAASKCSDCPVLRGGSWININFNCRVAFRLSSRSNYKDNCTGFRLAQD